MAVDPAQNDAFKLLNRTLADGPTATIVVTGHGPECAITGGYRYHGTGSPELAARARAGRFFYLVGGDPGLVPKVLAGTPSWEAIVSCAPA